MTIEKYAIVQIDLHEELKRDLDRILESTNLTERVFAKHALSFLRMYVKEVDKGYDFWYEKLNEPDSRVGIRLPGYEYKKGKTSRFLFEVQRGYRRNLNKFAKYYGHVLNRVIQDALELLIQYVDRIRDGYLLYKRKQGEPKIEVEILFPNSV